LWPRLLQWRTSSMDEKKDMAANMATFFARGDLRIGQLQSLGQET
jgi:hypothetical protein